MIACVEKKNRLNTYLAESALETGICGTTDRSLEEPRAGASRQIFRTDGRRKEIERELKIIRFIGRILKENVWENERKTVRDRDR